MTIVKITEVKTNPDNPRLIRDDKFDKLVKSIQDFPQMLELRPIIVNNDMVVLGGNMRLKACQAAGLKEIPIIIADQLTEEQQNEFIVKDNVGFGEWDWDVLANAWDVDELASWGVEFPFIDEDLDTTNFKDKLSSYDDSNCLYPLVPKYDEKHELFIIVSDNEVDSNWLREKLNMQRMSSYKNSEVSKSNVISMKDIKDVL
jgi:hypothetical protein